MTSFIIIAFTFFKKSAHRTQFNINNKKSLKMKKTYTKIHIRTLNNKKKLLCNNINYY